jgi:urate oxidase/2-oxo-4-hydroxy-4-carboxy-5-ureidoimidazoline decarboxylase
VHDFVSGHGRFASGEKRNYYGKGDVIVYRLQRDGRVAEGQSPVFGANVTILIYGDVFWPTYTTGDNTGLVATDSMKNFVQRETLAYTGRGLESYARFLAEKFLGTYPQAEGVQIEALEIPYAEIPDSKFAFAPSGPERATVRLELQRNNHEFRTVEVCSGICGFKLLRLGGSAFTGFVRDQYTTLPEIKNRPLHMWLDLEWSYTQSEAAFDGGRVTARVRSMVHEIFNGFESGSIQEIIYKIGRAMLERIPEIAVVRLEANNRTWDTVVEVGEAVGVYTEARPPFGCLGLTLRR